MPNEILTQIFEEVISSPLYPAPSPKNRFSTPPGVQDLDNNFHLFGYLCDAFAAYSNIVSVIMDVASRKLTLAVITTPATGERRALFQNYWQFTLAHGFDTIHHLYMVAHICGIEGDGDQLPGQSDNKALHDLSRISTRFSSLRSLNVCLYLSNSDTDKTWIELGLPRAIITVIDTIRALPTMTQAASLRFRHTVLTVDFTEVVEDKSAAIAESMVEELVLHLPSDYTKTRLLGFETKTFILSSSPADKVRFLRG